MDTIIGVFPDRHKAESAISDLDNRGFGSDDVSVIVREDIVTEGSKGGSVGATMAEGAVSGAATGGVIGGLAGLLVGLGAIVIPGIGGLFIAGPLAAALGLTGAAAVTVSGAATGAMAGGLVGALAGLGLPSETARIYEEKIREGGVVLAVTAAPSAADDVRRILKNRGATGLHSITTA